MIIDIEKAVVKDVYKNGDFSGCKIISKDFDGDVWSREVDLSQLPEIEPLEMKMDVKIKRGKNGLSVGVMSLNAKRLAAVGQPEKKGG